MSARIVNSVICCIDNRTPYQRSEKEWYHKEPCNYNPYLAKWEHEEGFVSLADCGVVSNAEGFSIDHNRVGVLQNSNMQVLD